MGGRNGAAKDQTDQEWNDDNCPMKSRHCFDNVFQFLSHLRKSADGPKYRSADKSACQAYQWLPFPTTSCKKLPIYAHQRVPQTWIQEVIFRDRRPASLHKAILRIATKNHPKSTNCHLSYHSRLAFWQQLEANECDGRWIMASDSFQTSCLAGASMADGVVVSCGHWKVKVNRVRRGRSRRILPVDGHPFLVLLFAVNNNNNNNVVRDCGRPGGWLISGTGGCFNSSDTSETVHICAARHHGKTKERSW
jgi:hypothetical protein